MEHDAWRRTVGDNDYVLGGGAVPLAGGLNAVRLDRVATVAGREIASTYNCSSSN